MYILFSRCVVSTLYGVLATNKKARTNKKKHECLLLRSKGRLTTRIDKSREGSIFIKKMFLLVNELKYLCSTKVLNVMSIKKRVY